MAWNRTPLCSKNWANIWSLVALVVLFFLLGYFDSWWKDLPLVFGVALLLRQYLLAKVYDAIATLVIFTPLYLFVRFDMAWNVLIPLPYLFVVAALFVLARELFVEWKGKRS